jgi:hypothetical protein
MKQREEEERAREDEEDMAAEKLAEGGGEDKDEDEKGEDTLLELPVKVETVAERAEREAEEERTRLAEEAERERLEEIARKEAVERAHANADAQAKIAEEERELEEQAWVDEGGEVSLGLVLLGGSVAGRRTHRDGEEGGGSGGGVVGRSGSRRGRPPEERHVRLPIHTLSGAIEGLMSYKHDHLATAPGAGQQKTPFDGEVEEQEMSSEVGGGAGHVALISHQ